MKSFLVLINSANMSQFASFSQENADKYPEEVQRLFQPRPPILHRKPLDHSAHLRKTSTITPISQWKTHIDSYKEEDTLQKSQKSTKGPNDTFLENHLTGNYNARLSQQLKARQVYEWENATPESLAHFKEPQKTVFVLRLDYRLQELDLLKCFSRYGDIDKITIIRNNSGKSRGYGFIVFEHEADAHNCIRELSPTGVQIPVLESDSDVCTALVDMERGRLIRNWKPRRLGGGLGGRHYTRPSSSALRNPYSSAAAARTYDRHGSQNSFGKDRRPHQQQRQGYYGLQNQQQYSRVPTKAYGDYSRPPQASNTQPEVPVSIKDKYAQYMGSSTTSSQSKESQEGSVYKYQRTSLSVRSVRNIRGDT